MSEYQYFEFQAIDRPINDDDMNEIRRVSSRAVVTSTSFVNEYNYGDFRGDEMEFMKRWFDFHLYLANWGTRRLMIRLPAHLVDRSQLDSFIRRTELIQIKSAGENIILDIFDGDEEEQHSGWEEGSGWLLPMIPLRLDLLSGDWRMLYLAWLWGVNLGYIRDDACEPLPGIAPLTGPLSAFAEFFRIDPDLVTAAAERPASGAEDSQLKDSVHTAISTLSDSEKTSLLCRLAQGDPFIESEIRKFVREFVAAPAESQQLRTAAELRTRAQEVSKDRKIAEAKREEAKRERFRQKAERERLERIARVAEMGEAAWKEIDVFLKIKSGRAYDEAAQRLFDLKIVADGNGTTEQFFARLDTVRRKYATRFRFIERLEELQH